MSTEDEKLVGDLNFMAAQLRNMAENASFVQNGYVRVSNADFLIASLSGAASAIRRLISERDEAREALRRIASRNFVYMTNSRSDNPDADAARALYREWKAIMEIARAARSPKPAKREGE